MPPLAAPRQRPAPPRPDGVPPGPAAAKQPAATPAAATPAAATPAATAPTRRPPEPVGTPFGPHWFAAVMGTGIVANAAAVLPVHLPGLRTAATGVWALAALLLAVLTAAWAVHRSRHRDRARAYADHPVLAYFWGAPAMALTTVGAGTWALGQDWIGARTALAVCAVLWSAGTLLGLLTCVWIPYRAMTGGRPAAADGAFGGWLMPVVPPMVSAATGAALVPRLPPGQGRLTLLLGCYAMFGISLFASLVIITLLWGRLVHHGVGPAALVPTLWIVLGPLGQSVTAANLLGHAAPYALPDPYAAAAGAFGFLYAVPAWGFAMMWLALAVSVTVRTARRGLPFSLTWWSFVFPLGTCVTGTAALAVRLDATVLRVVAVVLYALLVAGWLTVAVRTARGAVRGELLSPPGRADTGRADAQAARPVG